ncbi:MAG: ATP-binding cassette domain-containing protein [Lachnospiraceae bacterium]|jgi:oligopeptide transport system ATP-binding protein|nr:ATP-binding cassette domain-containing protein [Lachnospiraceae bacterium]
MQTQTGEPLLRIEGLTKFFPVSGGKRLFAVNKVTLEVGKGETLGIVGESGCGKSSMGRTILKVYEPNEGKIVFDGKDITKLSRKKMLPYRKRMQMIFQDPYASLNPRLTVGDIIEEPMTIHKIGTPASRKAKVQELIGVVGLKPDHIRRFPHEFSGGQRQRIGIARTLALEPDFIVCDEPISALDVSIQAQVINLLERIQKERGLSYLFIAHDLEMVHHISHKIGVMYLGHLVEYGDADEIYKRPKHPYTQALISASPVADPKSAREKHRIILEGEVPSPLDPPPGCPFSGRCPHVRDECRQILPDMYDYAGRKVACLQYSPKAQGITLQ